MKYSYPTILPIEKSDSYITLHTATITAYFSSKKYKSYNPSSQSKKRVEDTTATTISAQTSPMRLRRWLFVITPKKSILPHTHHLFYPSKDKWRQSSSRFQKNRHKSCPYSLYSSGKPIPAEIQANFFLYSPHRLLSTAISIVRAALSTRWEGTVSCSHHSPPLFQHKTTPAREDAL